MQAAKVCCSIIVAAAWLCAEASERRDPDETRARELFRDVCTACHTLERVKIQALSRDEWAGLIKGMVSEGVAITGEEMDLIVGYLARHYGDGSEKRVAQIHGSGEKK
jgi:hypothetical protein